jgi:aminomethyltransferase
MKYTRLHSRHEALGAKMIEFFDWHMPVEYTGIIEEHLAVRRRAGLFDVGHMGEIQVTGPEALAFLQYLTPNDVSRLAPLSAQYTALTTPQGTFVDDMLVYCLAPESYLLVVNASNADKDYDWVAGHASEHQVRVENMSGAYSQLALQGPEAEKTLQPLTDVPLAGMKSFGAGRGRVAGEEALVSRTGYTGEDGFEIYTLSPDPGIIWDAILKEGKDRGVEPVGLGARDTLRLEAKLMLYGNDIDETTTMIEADLKWVIKFKKGDFLGRDVLARQAEEGVERRIAGFEVVGRGIARPHYPVFFQGQEVAQVCSGTFAPYLKKSIGLVYLPTAATELGTEFEIGIRANRAAARVVATPFYKRGETPAGK